MIFREKQMQPKGHSKPANKPSGDVERLLVRKEGQGTRFTGTEPIFGGFTNSSTIISNIRLTHNGQIFVSIAEIGAALVTLSREYRFHGDAVRAYHEIVRIRSNFDSRVQQWKTEELDRLQSKKSMNDS